MKPRIALLWEAAWTEKGEVAREIDCGEGATLRIRTPKKTTHAGASRLPHTPQQARGVPASDTVLWGKTAAKLRGNRPQR